MCKFEGEDGDNGTCTSSKGKMETTEHAQVQRGLAVSEYSMVVGQVQRGRQGQRNMRKFKGD
jgi:hypothetical protein